MSTLSWAALAADIRAVAAAVQGPVALFGLSEGAAMTLLAAQGAAPNVSAAVVFYGSPGSKCTGDAPALFDAAKVNVPVHLACGTLDPFANFSSCDTLVALRSQLTGAPSTELYTYDNVGHGFLNNMGWWEAWKKAQAPPHEPCNPQVAALAMRRAVNFLAAHMGAAGARAP